MRQRSVVFLLTIYNKRKVRHKILVNHVLKNWLVFSRTRKDKRITKKGAPKTANSISNIIVILFTNVYYQQADDEAMSSPLRPTFVNLFLIHYETKWLAKCLAQFRPKYYRHYVDMFLMFKKKDHVKKLYQLST